VLPIVNYKKEIIGSLARHHKLTVTAPPGTGKSTQVPQFFADRCSPEKKLIMLEPRRIAARSLACRVAEEMGCACGNEVGYQVRSERKMSEKTKILFQTYGTFIQTLHSDPLAAQSSIMAFDEFHERSLEADMAFAWVRSLTQTSRRDLEIMVLTATLEHEPFRKYLKDGAVLDIQDNSFPVDIRYQPPASPQEPAAKQIERALGGLHRDGGQGSVLVFLPGAYEIERAAEALYDHCRRTGYRLLRLHGRMPLAEQQETLHLPGQEPCVILSTNVAETSLTVPGVTAVIDCGLARIASFDPERERNTLYLSRISMQNARQRTGRAGRLSAGVCVRLWSREDERSMPEAIVPEILRLDLSKAMLTLCAFSGSMPGGKKEIELLTPPSAERWERARDELLRFSAISKFMSTEKTSTCAVPVYPLTELGIAMSRLPVEPAVASVLLQCRSKEERTINAAMAAIWESGEKKQPESSDLFETAMAFIKEGKGRGWGSEVRETFEQLERLLKNDAPGMAPRTKKQHELREENARVWMRAFSHRIAVRNGDTARYEFPDKRCARLAVKSLRSGPQQLPRIILALAVREQAGRQQSTKTTIPLYLPLEAEWITETFSGEIRRGVECTWDEVRKRVTVEEQLSFRGVVLMRHEVENSARFRSEITSCLVSQLLHGAWDWKKDDPKAEQFVYRIKQVSSAYPEMRIPEMIGSDWELVYHELAEGKCSLQEVKSASIIGALKAYLGRHIDGFVEKTAPAAAVRKERQDHLF
jgi:ATP-dependent helicase HrpB